MKLKIYQSHDEILITTEDREQEMIKEWFEPWSPTGRHKVDFEVKEWDSELSIEHCISVQVNLSLKVDF